ncbi:MAG: peptide ABC transporter substrate-binding protein [Spirochaetota bacterium]
MNRLKKIHVPSFMVLVFFLLSAICPLYGENPNEKKDISIGLLPSDLGFNPLHTYTTTEAQVYTALYEGLVSYNPFTLEPIPAVARYWEISEDKKIYRFYLREDARYWNGLKVTAQHFKDSWLRLLNPAEKAEYSFLFDIIKNAQAYRLGKITNPDEVGIKVISENLLEVKLEQPAGHFLKILCHHSFVPIYPDFLDKKEWRSSVFIPGNGPFYILRRSPEEIVLRKNEMYWGAKDIKIPGIRLRFIDDPEKMSKLFNDGEIQWVADGAAIDKVANRETIIPNPLFSTNYYYFSSSQKPWDNPLVRKGLAFLLPWDKIRSNQILILPTETLVPRISDYPKVEGINARDVAKGLKFLEQAGYPRGDGLPEIHIKIPMGEEPERVVALVKETWEKEVNVKVSITEYDYPAYYDELKKNDYALGTITWIGDFADPLAFLQMWTSDSNLNDAQYKNNDFDSLIKKSMEETGRERYKILSEAEGLLLQEAIVLPVSHSPALNVIDLSEIDGWFPNALDIHPFKYLRYRVPTVKPGIVMDSATGKTG